MASVPQRMLGASVIIRAVMEPGPSALGRPLGCEQAGVAHEPQHPVLAHVELVLSSQARPDLAVALAGEGARR